MDTTGVEIIGECNTMILASIAFEVVCIRIGVVYFNLAEHQKGGMDKMNR